jgi:uncharacterized membrane protein YsdA (DUF1294 family)
MSHLAGLGACALLFAQIGACFAEAKARHKLRRLTQRLLNIDHELDHLTAK